MTTDQYYVREDEVETPETQLANIQAHQAAQKAVAVWAEEAFNGVHAQAEALWNEAAARGDVDSQNRINEIYQAVKHMKENLLHTNNAMSSVTEAAAALEKQKGDIEGELYTLLKAIEDVDSDDPRLSDLIEQVESGVYEFIQYNTPYDMDEDFEEDSSDYDNIVSDVYKHLRELVPNLTYANAEIFFASMKGDNALNDIQRGLLISLVRTFEVQAQTS